MELTAPAHNMIDNYSELILGSKHIRCPYANNKKTKTRAGLRVYIGKGSPYEITDEVTLLAIQKRFSLEQMSKDEIRQFLIDHNIGVDCSGFVYHVLDAETKERWNTPLYTYLKYPKKNLFRKLLQRLRPVEHTNVEVLGSDDNSHVVEPADARPGDMIVMRGFGEVGSGARNHVVLITKRDGNKLFYTHSLAWRNEPESKHGIKHGEIVIDDETAPIISARWYEAQKTGNENETFARAQKADSCEIRRLNILDEI